MTNPTPIPHSCANYLCHRPARRGQLCPGCAGARSLILAVETTLHRFLKNHPGGGAERVESVNAFADAMFRLIRAATGCRTESLAPRLGMWWWDGIDHPAAQAVA